MNKIVVCYGIFTVAYENNDINKKIIKVKAYNNTYGSLFWGKSEFEFAVNDVIQKIESGDYEFNTLIKNTSGEYEEGSQVIVYEMDGNKYIKTVSNGEKEDNLNDLLQYEI